ncbi:hypothetical protein SF148580_2641 [Shigella flexneri 1485-80]|nr:hypothetical protein SF148580_2641 [Shigella flexneri 1485-80]
MLHLKNITAGNPKTAEQYQMTKNMILPGFFDIPDNPCPAGARNLHETVFEVAH